MITRQRRSKSLPLERLFAWLLIGLPAVGFVLAVAWSAAKGFALRDLLLCAGMYLATALGITAGFHRLFAHKSFRAAAPVRYSLAILGCMAMQGPMLYWVASHRKHHRYSDQAGDPHSPHVHADGTPAGFWHAHVGWVFAHDHEGWYRYVPDLLADRGLVLIDRWFFAWVLLGLTLPAAVGYWLAPGLDGAVGGLLWGGLARTFLWHHATYSVNSVCHLFGKRPYETGDTSTNHGLCALVTLGEGWHNNHHAFPASARHGLAWHQLDLTWLTIRALGLVGLTSAHIVPEAGVMAAKRITATAPRGESDAA